MSDHDVRWPSYRWGDFIHCRSCEALFRPSPHDRAPEYVPTPDGYVEIMRDDCMEFLSRHARHSLETLRATGPPSWPNPHAAESYWPVSNGTESFVVQTWRAGLGQPLQYRMRRGRLVTESLTVDVPCDAIREELDRALYPGVVPERKLAAFLTEFTTAVRALDPAALDLLHDIPGEPSARAARLPASVITALVSRIATLFDAGDRARIEERLRADDGFLVIVRHLFRIAS